MFFVERHINVDYYYYYYNVSLNWPCYDACRNSAFTSQSNGNDSFKFNDVSCDFVYNQISDLKMFSFSADFSFFCCSNLRIIFYFQPNFSYFTLISSCFSAFLSIFSVFNKRSFSCLKYVKRITISQQVWINSVSNCLNWLLLMYLHHLLIFIQRVSIKVPQFSEKY